MSGSTRTPCSCTRRRLPASSSSSSARVRLPDVVVASQTRSPGEHRLRLARTAGGPSPTATRAAGAGRSSAGCSACRPFTRELMRATFWCPPHPPEVEVTDDNVPYMQVYKKHQPDVWTHELREMTMLDLLDEHCETEHFKTAMAFAAWASGAAGHWEGVAIPAVHGGAAPDTAQHGKPQHPARRPARLLPRHPSRGREPRRRGPDLLPGRRDPRSTTAAPWECGCARPRRWADGPSAPTRR